MKKSKVYKASEHLTYARYPMWWSNVSREKLDNILKNVEWVYAKKEREYPNSKNFVPLHYANIPVSFDIEDTSFYNEEGEKVSTMYVWQLGVAGLVFMGRTWEEFRDMINTLKTWSGRHDRIIVYVHFLDHEFQFIRKMFKWSSIFSRKQRSPIYAITGGVEFRDSYILTGKSLAKSAEDIRTYRGMKKQCGDLDYTLIRGTKTPLTKKEIGYCMKDVQILNVLIAEKIEDEGGNISRIPLTNTGYVRRYVRNMCMPKGKKNKEKADAYYRMIHFLQISPAEYEVMTWAFQGGFTHANALWVGEDIKKRVDSIDFTSSYPTVMISEVFPMSAGKRVVPHSQGELNMYLRDYLSIFVITFYNIRKKSGVYDTTISRSKCTDCDNAVVNNGRVVSADKLKTAMTNVDLEMVKRFYDYEYFTIERMYIYKKGYLPLPVVQAVLELYRAKTELKGITEAAVEYMIKKGMLNSIYGMMVTSIIKALEQCSENGEWEGAVPPDVAEALNKYNNDKKRFNFFPWGCFITSYARRNLQLGILEFGRDYLYSDTDSIKAINFDKHKAWVEAYNKNIVEKIDKVLGYYNLPLEASRPKNKKGKEKQIGIWDWETEDAPYNEFKTLGAKRYMCTQDEVDNKGRHHKNVLHITIAGVGKKSGAEYIGKQKDPFNFFSDGMEIPAESSGKLTHTYLDYEQEGVLKDYRGNYMAYHELSSVHLEKASYKMSMTEEFSDYVLGYRDMTA